MLRSYQNCCLAIVGLTVKSRFRLLDVSEERVDVVQQKAVAMTRKISWSLRVEKEEIGTSTQFLKY